MTRLSHGLILVPVAALIGTGAIAQPIGPWGPQWGAMPSPYGPFGRSFGEDPREGKIDSAHFLGSPVSAELGHGTIVIDRDKANGPQGESDDLFEGAALAQLSRVGYSTSAPADQSRQTFEISVVHAVISPPEPPHGPVSGEVSVGGGNFGAGGGIAIAVDLSKPRGPLIETDVEARIVDRSTKQILWQARASIVTRDGDKHWNSETIASRLTAAMFKGFPSAR